jgi:Na+/H+-dicarboxylate symporter
VLGWLDHTTCGSDTDLASMVNPLSTIFLRMIKSIVAPLLFASLVVGNRRATADDLKKVGRLALKVAALLSRWSPRSRCSCGWGRCT